jgi:NTP pyrophosphatase (non-canonical NTP hydrolase)
VQRRKQMANDQLKLGMGLNDLAAIIAANARNKGFHEYTPTFGVAGRDTRHILSWLMLMVTEVAEAAEATRIGDRDNFGEELADVIIRVLDTATIMGINIDLEVVTKMQKNFARPMMHGGKLA